MYDLKQIFKLFLTNFWELFNRIYHSCHPKTRNIKCVYKIASNLNHKFLASSWLRWKDVSLWAEWYWSFSDWYQWLWMAFLYMIIPCFGSRKPKILLNQSTPSCCESQPCWQQDCWSVLYTCLKLAHWFICRHFFWFT